MARSVDEMLDAIGNVNMDNFETPLEQRKRLDGYMDMIVQVPDRKWTCDQKNFIDDMVLRFSKGDFKLTPNQDSYLQALYGKAVKWMN